MRSMLNAERLKNVQIHQALFRSLLSSVFSCVAVATPWPPSPAEACVGSAIACLRSCWSFGLQAREVQIIDDGDERANHGDSDGWNLQIHDQHPPEQEPDEHFG